MKKFYSLFFITIYITSFLSKLSFPQEEKSPQKISLLDAIEIAKKNNLDIIKAKEQINESYGYTKTIHSQILPEFTGSVLNLRQQKSRVALGLTDELNFLFPDYVGPYNLFGEEINMQFPVLNLKALNEFLSAKSNETLTELQAKVVEENVISQVSSLYFEVLRDIEAVKSTEENVKRYEKRLEVIKDKRKAGLATDIDVKSSEYELSKAKSELKVVQTQLTYSTTQLKQSLNIDISEDIELTDTLIFQPIQPLEIETATDIALKQRPDFLAQKQKEKVDLYQVKSAKCSWIPEINIYGRYGREGEEISDIIPVWSIGIQLDIPIWDSFKRKGTLEQKESQLLQTKDITEKVKAQIKNEIQVIYEQMESAKNVVEVSIEYVALEEERLKQKQDELKAGTATQDDVFVAEVNLSKAKFQKIDAIYKYNISKVNWFRALGNTSQIIE